MIRPTLNAMRSVGASFLIPLLLLVGFSVYTFSNAPCKTELLMRNYIDGKGFRPFTVIMNNGHSYSFPSGVVSITYRNGYMKISTATNDVWLVRDSISEVLATP